MPPIWGLASLSKPIGGLPGSTPYFALAIFPVAFLLGFSFNPPEFLWGVRRAVRGLPHEAMPDSLREKAAAFRRYAFFLGDALILGLVYLLALRDSVPVARFGFYFVNWRHDAATGVGAGALLVLAQRVALALTPIDPEDASPGSYAWHVRRGSPLLWLLIFAAGAFSEEVWVAFCLVALRATGHSSAAAVGATMLVFAAVHYSYRLWGATAAGLKEAVSAVLFLHFGSLLVTVPYHFIGNLGSLYWNRYWHH